MLKEVVAVLPVSGSKNCGGFPNSARPSPDPAALRPQLLYTTSFPLPPAAPAHAQTPAAIWDLLVGGLQEDTLPVVPRSYLPPLCRCPGDARACLIWHKTGVWATEPCQELN